MTAPLPEVSTGSLKQAALDAKTWLFEAAAPLWSEIGRTPTGLFAERMTLEGESHREYFRTFVQARHIYAFSTIGRMGWKGRWRELVGETMTLLLTRAKRTDGLYCHQLGPDGEQSDLRADLYDQAFVLFALAAAGESLGREEWFDEAESLLELLKAKWSHSRGGFAEGELVNKTVRRQNPHMHLLEAFLALHEASGRDVFRDSAHEIACLARDRFIDRPTGALLEYFADDLSPAAGIQGRIAEPGHCFEWAWLFERFAANGWGDGTLLSDRLTWFARKHGIDKGRGVAINEVLIDGRVHDGKARLWPQTERLKAALSRCLRLNDETEAEEAMAAYRGLAKYLTVPLAGLWRDKLQVDGSWIDELAPGSSLYHITCAYEQLQSFA